MSTQKRGYAGGIPAAKREKVSLQELIDTKKEPTTRTIVCGQWKLRCHHHLLLPCEMLQQEFAGDIEVDKRFEEVMFEFMFPSLIVCRSSRNV
eukprot:EC719302.1.p1 GENE.EC719302.1~~EC719302.1.p1  ORF type:complete len:93 (+),score=0.75 EC719302.1:23-301(+)